MAGAGFMRLPLYRTQNCDMPSRELAAASHFFKHHLPSRQWTGNTWRHKEDQPKDLPVPEVIFLGRSNVGKSSLINALTSQDLNRVSATPGATQVMAAWTLAAKYRDGGAVPGWDGDVSAKISLVDMPGYGFGSHADWSKSIMGYLVERRNIRRAFVLLDSIHGATGADRHMIEVLRGLAIPYQVVATKCDRLVAYKGSQDEVRSALTTLRAQAQLETHYELGLGEIISVGSMQVALKGQRALNAVTTPFGLHNLQWAVLRAAGLDTYAVQKASAHGVLKNVAADEQSTLHIEGPPRSATSVVVGSPVERAPDTVDSSFEPSVSDVSIEDFMREILNSSTPPPSSALPAKTSSPRTHRSAAKVYNGIMNNFSAFPDDHDFPSQSKATKDDRTQAQTAIDAALQFAQKELRDDPMRLWEESKPTDVKPASMRGLPPISELSTKADTLNSRKEGERRKTTRPLPNASYNPTVKQAMTGMDALVAKAGQVSPQKATQAPTRATEKGVTHGIDAFEALFDEEPKGRTQRNTAKSGKGKPRATLQAKSRAQPREPSTKSAIAGKGVVQGMDAFESMFDEGRTSSSSRRRRR
ncbi:hypothetical protein LTR10_016727 [Elasticomyces elasticus]|uniref:EngB-type G domain-containing protein n=1 Tax=Exophiala sideris TaxID=1016849 RepID=A0ABR0JQM9_9EURO|nr:hypothetical protein LTR10_016727 [Elasticomyces elasticus]KAK5039834.1 hypothetical protein LTS07_000329 [Exophiala sideris]KAK5041386.1 hypothetical protein LTR13_002861 [Exophiala sideris]KAK5068213.1 hypothetical protein LTR69_000331 [Exophiala sideris]KAK5187514.1 hypothetical protein LTR44_000330 [Eurotiomycetes sp. CCFEE 6388]